MVSIKRRRQIRSFIIFFIVFIVFISIFLTLGFFPYGLHKKNMSDVAMPKDAVMYMSVKSLNDSIIKITDSAYAYRISHDDAMFDFSLSLKSAESFFNSLKNNQKLYIRLLSKYMFRRNASILFWHSSGLADRSEIYFMFDLGKLPGFFFNLFIRNGKVSIENESYNIKRVKYNNANIYSLENETGIFMFFTIYKGVFTCAKEYNYVKKIIDFFDSKTSNFGDIAILQDAKENRVSDISLYINKKLYDNNNIRTNFLFTPLKFFKNFSSIYAFANIYENKCALDIYTDYEYGGSDRYSLYNLGGITNLANYLSKENTVMFLALKSYISGLYPLIYNDFKNDSLSSPLAFKVYNSFNRLNDLYSLSDIIKEANGESGFAYVQSDNYNINFPIIIFDIKDENKFIPLFEGYLIKKYNDVKKVQKAYNNGFIYTYIFPDGRELYYTFKDKVYFISEHDKAMEIVIDGFYSNNSLADYIRKNAKNIKNTDYLFTFDFLKGQNILKSLNMPLKTWSYPESIIAGSTIGSNSTHLEIDFYANFKPIKR